MRALLLGIFMSVFAGIASGSCALCDSPGILVCDNFDRERPNTLYWNGTPPNTRPSIESGNLVFRIESGSGANAAGDYRVEFPPVKEGENIYFYYRIKADAEAFQQPQLEGRKQFIMWRGAESCATTQLAQTHRIGDPPILSPYSACGQRSFSVPIPNSGGDIQFHYPDFDCKYRQVKNFKNYTNCAVTVPEVWQSFYVEVNIGNWNTPNSTVRMWLRTDGGDWKRYIERTDYIFDSSPSQISAGFDHFSLTPYMTDKDPLTPHNPVVIRYDALVISRLPFKSRI
jgi:hypothetical protein